MLTRHDIHTMQATEWRKRHRLVYEMAGLVSRQEAEQSMGFAKLFVEEMRLPITTVPILHARTQQNPRLGCATPGDVLHSGQPSRPILEVHPLCIMSFLGRLQSTHALLVGEFASWRLCVSSPERTLP